MSVISNMENLTFSSIFRRFGMIFAERERERVRRVNCYSSASLPVFCLYLFYHSTFLSSAVVFVLLFFKLLFILNYYYV